MEYVGIVVISHSLHVANGIKEIIRQVIKDVPVEVAGGTDDGEIGTSIHKITSAIHKAHTTKGVILFYDLGSAKMNAELAIEMIELEHIILAEAPLLEGAYVAAVESSIGKSITEIQQSIQKSFNCN